MMSESCRRFPTVVRVWSSSFTIWTLRSHSWSRPRPWQFLGQRPRQWTWRRCNTSSLEVLHMKLSELPAMVVERIEDDSEGLRVHGRFDRLDGVAESGMF